MHRYNAREYWQNYCNTIDYKLRTIWRIDAAVDQWLTRLRPCVRANGRHFEHTS